MHRDIKTESFTDYSKKYILEFRVFLGVKMEGVFDLPSEKEGRSKKKPKCRLPRRYFTDSFITKTVLTDDRDREPGESLPLPKDPSGMESADVSYSLNKKGRWKLPRKFRNGISEWQDDKNKLKVSAI